MPPLKEKESYIEKYQKQWRKHDYNYVYTNLQKMGYSYILDNFERDFKKIKSEDRFSYLIYLLSKEYTPQHVILLCDLLMFTDMFFYYIHPVINMFLQQALLVFPNDKLLLQWIACNYEGHPDSPFSKDEIEVDTYLDIPEGEE